MQKRPKVLSLFIVVAVTGPLPSCGAKKRKRAPNRREKLPVAFSLFCGASLETFRSKICFMEPGAKNTNRTVPSPFLKEDLEGTNPKFDVTDADGVKWKVKLGDEARPETVASRLVWSLGYHTDWDYFLPAIQVKEMPSGCIAARSWLDRMASVQNVRLKREPEGEKKIGTWKWRHDPFTGTREWNGLRVLMAVINNWDLKDENNAIHEAKQPEDGEERIYEISDLGSSFRQERPVAGSQEVQGRSGSCTSAPSSSRRSARITSISRRRAAPMWWRWLIRMSFSAGWACAGSPSGCRVEDARWMGEMLAQLSPAQIRAAFRAGGYSPQEVDGFTSVVEARIAQLNKL